ncbi:ADP-ribose pyrophosphatase YjhB, NUDIX family [Pseudoxanthobacter soli DSM 19599]|uniref:ADP-ribose pyrophosphatase YjhB, NUDIX family n=1 Tax=Pseudoxanthobacter soli DSM 19599 TaxID=1123029 RepID=A0A1M7ZQJ5_9HYPH|nr:NUDIX domain-containing protein [Pseudoxanthobacter soli]SHO67092.1 ADP-ribose pyrophosphatase YjhB, NUDIX family [Pseudoxanthobacter soli DSM 19599]
MTTQHPIRIAAAVIVRADGMTLLVRKRGSAVFIQPGGKIEAAETPVEALCRELREELGLAVAPSEPAHVGRLSAPAANERGHIVEAELFRLRVDAPVRPAAEIEEVRWVDPAAPETLPPWEAVAPLTRDHIFPLLWPQAPSAAAAGGSLSRSDRAIGSQSG